MKLPYTFLRYDWVYKNFLIVSLNDGKSELGPMSLVMDDCPLYMLFILSLLKIEDLFGEKKVLTYLHKLTYVFYN